MNATGGIYGWYFCREYPEDRIYASKGALDALRCAKGPLCHRVFIKGPVEFRNGRFSGASYTIIYRVDCTNLLKEFTEAIYQIIGSKANRKSEDLCINTWLSAVEVSGRTGWFNLNKLLEDLINREMEKTRSAN